MAHTVQDHKEAFIRRESLDMDIGHMMRWAQWSIKCRNKSV